MNETNLTENYRIFFSNIGYARGINGLLRDHLIYGYRHFYCPPWVQDEVLLQINNLIAQKDPDLCCFVEIDQGFLKKPGHDQLPKLLGNKYGFFNIENKYAQNSLLRNLILTKGKSNAFMSKKNLEFEKIYFDFGIKKLIYKIKIKENITLFFSHFSLKKKIREKQLQQVKKLFEQTPGEVIFLGDFNILKGLEELKPLLDQNNLVLLNDPTKPTFTFHKSHLLLDLCICTKTIAPFINLQIHPQPYSDHAALTLDIKFS